jgi:hypothetical protein
MREAGVHSRRGRSQELQQFGAGKLTAQLEDKDRAFDTLNTLSPYYPNVDSEKPVRLRAEYPWFPGQLPSGTFEGPDGSGSLVGWSALGTGTTNLETGVVYLGKNSCKFTSTATQAEGGIRSDAQAIVGGQNIVVTFRARPAAGTKNYKYRVEFFYDAAGTMPLSSQTSVLVPATAGSWTRIMESVQTSVFVPPAAGGVRVSVLQDSPSNGDITYFDCVVMDYGTFQGIFPVWYGYIDKLTPRVQGLDRVVELEATDAFALFSLMKLTTTGYADTIKAGVPWDIFNTIKLPTDYWRCGDREPLFSLHDEMGLSDLTALGNVNAGEAGAIIGDTDTAIQTQANPGGSAFSVGALLTHQGGAFECWLKWQDTGQALNSLVAIAGQAMIVPLPGWANHPLLIAMAGDGLIDSFGNAVPRGRLCYLMYDFDGSTEHVVEAWGGPLAMIPGDNQWHHLVVGLDGTAAFFNAYIDGSSTAVP